MRTVDLIQKKRDGKALTTDEIEFLIRGYSTGEIPDYQMSAWAMAVFFNGMTAKETADLTLAMARSGDQADLSPIEGIKVDKHSTGGVGDTTTLILAPLVAAAGVPVAKMSGRGLGHTGGTIDKLESIAGYRVELSKEDFLRQVQQIGVSVISQSGNITPADKKLYGLRDVTATVESIPLIASSIMSKKIASGTDAIVLDVKTGGGAFMKSLDESIKLAQAMVEIGGQVGRETVAVITDMEEPLGLAVGNALEVREAIDTLRGEGPADLTELCLVLGAHMVRLGGKAATYEEARSITEELLRSGAALDKLKEWWQAQGGNPEMADHPELLPTAEYQVPVAAVDDGVVSAIDAEALGVTAMMLGAGRAKKDDDIDLSVGILLRKKVGDRVTAGETIAELHMNSNEPMFTEDMTQRTREVFTFAAGEMPKAPLIYAVVTKHGVERIHTD
ncbi:pyrimidine-nucleoside phosphorylase [Paenibacillus xerothermodurans]|uniref:Pyrimidine-nucleoside phosphorylase n=1 Tax=Paenibacillus xerothermodurans TaxID=1977292 RepID=A0A2W1NDG6_PAEXE|nr:pyrimidine-nucleoside phosphorylase [Paenibacillus xerothermodurans]PZE22004.1 pyrimidine-nucleoside phosphorylase [Paenibacillus xerothermodurans]